VAGKDSKNPKLYNVQHLSELAESPLYAETNYVKDNVYGAVYAGEVIARERVHPVHSMNTDQRQPAADS